jgi:steroid delta-isomerase-like uncharacterized protein
MSAPHPVSPNYAESYSRAWTSDPLALLQFFAPEGSYTDVAMNSTYRGHDDIARFHRWMLKFAPDSVVEFGDGCAAGGRLYLDWVWSGSFRGSLRLPRGSIVEGTGQSFSVAGVAACRYDDDGKLLSHRDYWDLQTMLAQLGESGGA